MMKTIKIGNGSVNVSDEMVQYSRYRNTYIPFAEEAGTIFSKGYMEAVFAGDSVDAFMGLMLNSLKPVINHCMKQLMIAGIYDIEEQEFFEKYCDPYIEFYDYFKEYAGLCMEIADALAARMAIRAENSMNASNPWVGGGFGIKGAIKGALYAKGANMISNSLRASRDRKADKEDMESASIAIADIFMNPDVQTELRNAIKNSALNIHLAYLDVLRLHDIDEYPVDVAGNRKKAVAIFNNVINLELDFEEASKPLGQLFELYPFDLSVYRAMIEKYGDKDGVFQSIADAYEVDITKCKRDAISAALETKCVSYEDIVSMCEEKGFNVKLPASIPTGEDDAAKAVDSLINGRSYMLKEDEESTLIDKIQAYEKDRAKQIKAVSAYYSMSRKMNLEKRIELHNIRVLLEKQFAEPIFWTKPSKKEQHYVVFLLKEIYVSKDDATLSYRNIDAIEYEQGKGVFLKAGSNKKYLLSDIKNESADLLAKLLENFAAIISKDVEAEKIPTDREVAAEERYDKAVSATEKSKSSQGKKDADKKPEYAFDGERAVMDFLDSKALSNQEFTALTEKILTETGTEEFKKFILKYSKKFPQLKELEPFAVFQYGEDDGAIVFGKNGATIIDSDLYGYGLGWSEDKKTMPLDKIDYFEIVNENYKLGIMARSGDESPKWRLHVGNTTKRILIFTAGLLNVLLVSAKKAAGLKPELNMNVLAMPAETANLLYVGKDVFKRCYFYYCFDSSAYKNSQVLKNFRVKVVDCLTLSDLDLSCKYYRNFKDEGVMFVFATGMIKKLGSGLILTTQHLITYTGADYTRYDLSKIRFIEPLSKGMRMYMDNGEEIVYISDFLPYEIDDIEKLMFTVSELVCVMKAHGERILEALNAGTMPVKKTPVSSVTKAATGVSQGTSASGAVKESATSETSKGIAMVGAVGVKSAVTATSGKSTASGADKKNPSDGLHKMSPGLAKKYEEMMPLLKPIIPALRKFGESIQNPLTIYRLMEWDGKEKLIDRDNPPVFCAIYDMHFASFGEQYITFIDKFSDMGYYFLVYLDKLVIYARGKEYKHPLSRIMNITFNEGIFSTTMVLHLVTGLTEKIPADIAVKECVRGLYDVIKKVREINLNNKPAQNPTSAAPVAEKADVQENVPQGEVAESVQQVLQMATMGIMQPAPQPVQQPAPQPAPQPVQPAPQPAPQPVQPEPQPATQPIAHMIVQPTIELLMKIYNEAMRLDVNRPSEALSVRNYSVKYEKKMKNAMGKYVIITDDMPILLYDYTIFESGKEGFVISNKYFYYNFSGNSGRMELSQLDRFVLNGNRVFLRCVGGFQLCVIAVNVSPEVAQHRMEFLNFVLNELRPQA